MSEFMAKMHENSISARGSTPDPTGGAYSAPPDLLAVFKGSASEGREGKRGRGDEGQEKGRRRK